MIGLHGIGLGASVQCWRPVTTNRTAVVSRSLPKATDQPVAPVSSVPTVGRDQLSAVQLSGFRYQPGTDPVELSVRSRIQYLSQEDLEAEISMSKSAQEVMAEGECQTCRERKYQDGSDDPGVSFKTPTNVAPELAASAVRGHEQEHVVREQAEARREGREVVSQSVTYHTAICPECGKVYVSGGTTRTSTRAVQEQPDAGAELEGRIPFSAVA